MKKFDYFPYITLLTVPTAAIYIADRDYLHYEKLDEIAGERERVKFQESSHQDNKELESIEDS